MRWIISYRYAQEESTGSTTSSFSTRKKTEPREGELICDPVTAAIAIGVTSVASTVGSVVAQGKAAQQQVNAIEAQRRLINEENRLATSGDIFERDREARREQGRVRAAAGEAGLGLGSGAVETLLLDSAMQAELANQRSIANLESRRNATNQEAESATSQVKAPSTLGAGLQIASSAVGAFSNIQGAKIPTQKVG